LPVVVGDRVVVSPTSEGEAVLEEILPRRTEMRRARALAGRAVTGRRRTKRGSQRQVEVVVAANVDRVLSVQAALVPFPSWSLVDRVLISAAWEGVEAGVCLNKWDQVADEPDAAEYLEECLDVYRGLGHATFCTSGLHGEGIDALRAWLAGKVTVFSGHSGVGKSTLLNALCPGLEVQTGHLSAQTGKGRHVTTAVAFYDLPGADGGAVIDTPGYREYGLTALEPAQLGPHYVEFQPHIGDCRFKDCRHVDEPECAVLAALDRGEISGLRYESYLSVLESLD